MEEPKITPLARRLAEENGIDWRKLQGTGPDGLIVERDILAYLAKVMAGEVDLPPQPEAPPPPPKEEELKRAQEVLGPGDLEALALRLLRHPQALARVVERFPHVLVDEYQDTSPVQYRFTRLLAGEEANLMAVGDPDQGIYSFRAADIKNILDFTRDYPEALMEVLYLFADL